MDNKHSYLLMKYIVGIRLNKMPYYLILKRAYLYSLGLRRRTLITRWYHPCYPDANFLNYMHWTNNRLVLETALGRLTAMVNGILKFIQSYSTLGLFCSWYFERFKCGCWQFFQRQNLRWMGIYRS